MSKDKILYIGGFELPDKNAAAHRVIANAKIFREIGYDVIFIDVRKDLIYGQDFLKTKRFIQGFECYSLVYPKSKKEWIDYLTDISKYEIIFELYKEITMVVCYNYQAIALRKILHLCKRKKIKLIGDCTEWYSAKGNGLVFFLLKGFDTFYRMRILHKKLDGLIVISDYLEKYYSSCKNVINIPPLVDLEESKWRIDSSHKNEVVTLTYAGSPGRKDKIGLLISALSKMEVEYCFNIIGITKEEYLKIYPEDKEMIASMNKKIAFKGRLSHAEALEFVKNADYACFFREDNRVSRAGFPTKLVESISCGTPVITNGSSSVDKYIKEGRNGVFIKNSNEESVRDMLLKEVFNKEIELIIESTRFDYRKYINIVSVFLKGIFSS